MLELMLSEKKYDAKLSIQGHLNCVGRMWVSLKGKKVNCDFLGKWEVNEGWTLLPLCVSVLFKFSTGIVYWEGRKHTYEKQIQGGTETCFERWCSPSLLTLHFLWEVISCAHEHQISSHGDDSDTYVPGPHRSSELLNCAPPRSLQTILCDGPLEPQPRGYGWPVVLLSTPQSKSSVLQS